MAADSYIGEKIRDLAVECGIEFDEEGTSVIDHHNYDVNDDGKVCLLLLGSLYPLIQDTTGFPFAFVL